MPSTQDLRRKIKSVKATGKLTRAMQMVAASKMARAQAAALASRTYASEAWRILGTLSKRAPVEHPFFASKETQTALSVDEGRSARRLIVAITSNRGLAGGLNSQLIRLVSKELAANVDLITIGRKGASYFKRFTASNLVADFIASNGTPEVKEVTPIVKLVTDGFRDGTYDRVDIAYNHFVSSLTQRPSLMQLLPIVPELAPGEEATDEELLVEPDPQTVLDTLAARIVPLRLYQTLLEASASEHSARMVAMKSATDNAKDIAADLTLTYQSVRQANITREIIEVSAGANALAG